MSHLVRTLAVALITVLALTSCSHRLDGRAVAGSRSVDQSYFFAGDVPSYGQTVSANDLTALAYLRALRRVDVCGLLNGAPMAKIGEIGSLGTLFAFSECDIDVKVSGAPARKLISVEFMMSRNPGQAVAFRVGDTPVYEDVPDSCHYRLPLPLSRLPGARPLHKPEQPLVDVGLIADRDCGFAQRIARALADWLATAPLPPRDAVAVYPLPLAERDPCQVLSVIGADTDHWDIGAGQPHDCRFSIWRSGLPAAVAMRVQLEPQLVEAVTVGHDRRQQGGVEVYVDPRSCSAVSFVGGPMQRRVIGAGYVDPRDIVIRPAVVVGSGDKNCDAAADVAARAAKLYS